MVFGKRLAYARCSINKNTSLVEYDSPFTTGVLKLWTSHRVNGSQRELSYPPSCVFQVALVVKNPPAMQEMQVRSLGQEDPLEKGMTTDSSILSWRILEPGGLQSMGSQRVGHNWSQWAHLHAYSLLGYLGTANKHFWSEVRNESMNKNIYK